METGISPQALLEAPPEIIESMLRIFEEREQQRQREELRAKL